METLRVTEAFRNLFYSPLYVAMGLGAFRDEDIEIDLRTRQPNEAMIRLLREGQADIVLTGIMRSLVGADAGEPDLPISFIEVNSRDGFMLLSRRRFAPFRWSDLEGRTVLTYSEPPTPWMTLLSVLDRHGVDRSRVTFATDRQAPEALQAFKDGFGDFIELPEPFAELLIREGAAYLAAPMGSFAGDIPYSSFATLRSFLENRRDTALRFTRAVYRAQRWMAQNDAESIARLAQQQLPDVPLDVLTTGVERYQGQGTWASEPLMRRESFERFQDILRNGGLIRGTYRFEDLVDTSIASEVIASTAAT